MSDIELIDMVDVHDQVLGALPRSLLAASPYGFRVVHVLVRDHAGDLLLQRPAASRGKPFRYGSSVAGHVHSGESYAAAAAREYLEELGLPSPPLCDLGRTWFDEAERRKFIGVFTGEERRDLTPDPREVEEIVRMPPAAVRRLLRTDPTAFSDTFARVFAHATEFGLIE